MGLSSQDVATFLNRRRLMERKLAEIGMGGDLRAGAFHLIDRRDKLPAKKWSAWALELGLSTAQLQELQALLADPELWQESEKLQVFDTAEAFGLADYLVYDARFVRGLDYYTGPVFEAYPRDKTSRAILGGGRYDNLVADMGGDRITGVGFAMGDLVVKLLLGDVGKRPGLPASPSQVLVTLFSEDLRKETLGLAARLRQAGINAEQILEPIRLGKQFRFADRKGIRYVVILGPEELAAGWIVVKNLETGDQNAYPEDRAIEVMKSN